MGPSEANADPQSFDRLAADYDRYASLEPPLILDWLRIQLPGRGGRALDAGCGSGRHTLALADRFDQVVGVDRSQPLIDIARHKRPQPHIRYQIGDLMAITDPAGFDLMLSSTTLHHLPDLEADARRHGWPQAWWLLKFRTSTPWLEHLTGDRYLSRQGFEQRYGAVFPGARFHALGHTHALLWHSPAKPPGGSATGS